MTIDRTKVKQRRHANTAASYAMSAEPAPAPSVKPAINPLTGRPFVDVPGLPANASFFQRVRARLPSKRWATFWAVLFAAGGYVKYDNWQIKKIQEELKERVRELSDRPWVPTERVEKVTVVVGVPVANVSAGNPRDAFREFVKPGALRWKVLGV